VPASSGDRTAARLVLLIGAVASALLLWSRRGYVPLWDGRIYAECVMQASRDLLAFGGYRCAGHISQSYVAVLALAQRAAPTSFAPMLGVNVLLLALGAVALHRLLRQVFPDESHRLGRAFVVAVFLVHPIVLASAVQPGLDFGLLVFSLCALAAVLEGRRWIVVAFGLMLVFSKEPGVLVYGLIAAVYLWRFRLRQLMPDAVYWLSVGALAIGALLNVVRLDVFSALLFALGLWVLSWRKLQPAGRPPFRAAFRAIVAEWPIAVPILLLGAYLGASVARNAYAANPAAPVVWSTEGHSSPIATLFRPNVLDHATLVVLALMLVIGFLWLPTVIMAIDLGKGIIGRRRQSIPRPLPGVDSAALGVVTAALVGEVWLLSRYVTYANARYYLPMYPLALLMTYAAVVRLGVPRAVRAAGFGLLGVLFCVSAVRTVDPVSRLLWGTFPVGDRTMLHMTSLTGECCGYGRDQLVYNLEFTEFDALQSAAYARLRPTESTTVVLPVYGDWYTMGPIDRTTLRRTLRPDGSIWPRVRNAYTATLPQGQVSEAWYLEAPYVNNARSLEYLSRFYEIGAPTYVGHNGYAMAVRRVRLRSAPLTASPSGSQR
jgi:hypothetical protein